MARLPDDPVLLRNVQDYLRFLLQRIPPPPHLKRAWDDFFLCYDPVLSDNARHYRISAEAKQCLVVEVWRQVVVSLPSFVVSPDGGGFRAWLCELMNKFVDGVRQQAAHTEEDIGRVLRKEAEPGVWAANPEILFQRAQDCEIVHQAMEELRGQLPETDFHVFELFWLHQLSVAEIMRVVPWSSRRIRKRLACTLPKMEAIITWISEHGADSKGS
jgi:DNA-directed RNA polymerase specialized sigma24 family protein